MKIAVYVNHRYRIVETESEFLSRIESYSLSLRENNWFNQFLDEHYDASQIWDLSEEEREKIKEEFEKELREESESDLLHEGWERVELEV